MVDRSALADAPSPSLSTAPDTKAVIDAVPFSHIALEDLKATEWQGAGPSVIRLFDLADGMVRRGIRYRKYKLSRQLAPTDLTLFTPRLSCSEFVWYLFSLAGFRMGAHPIKSKTMAFGDNIYPQALIKVTDGSVKPGDVLVYANSTEELKKQKELFGKSQVGHVVIVLSVERKLVVGSHGRESTPEGGSTGVGYRRLLQGWEQWTHERLLRATYRLKDDA